MISIGIGLWGSGLTLAQRITAIFSTGTNGFIYDPSDMASLYQDSAGTTPVTAVTNPVGKASDKSGNTNHAIQATAAARPTWTNRVNLLTYTEQFDNAVWVKQLVTISANAVTAPDGTLSADLLYPLSTGIYRSVYVGGVGGIAHTLSVYAKAGGKNFVYLILDGGTPAAWFDLSTGTIGTIKPGFTASITDVGDGWYRCSAFGVPVIEQIGVSDTDNSPSVTVDGTSGIYIWGAQLTLGAQTNNYQRVTTATDFDTVGFPYYLSFLGTDDSLSSATGGGGSAGFFWCGAVLPTGGAGTLQTLFADNGTNTGYKVQKDVNNKLSFSAGDNAAFTTKVSTAALSVGTKVMLTVWDDGVNLNVQIGDATAETVARPVVVAGTAGFTIGKDNTAVDNFFIGNLYASVYFRDTAGTAADRAIAQDYCRLMGGM